MKTSVSNRKHVVGLTCLVLACLLSFVPYFLIFTIPLFLIGVALVYLSTIDTPSKIAVCLLFALPPSIFYFVLINK